MINIALETKGKLLVREIVGNCFICFVLVGSYCARCIVIIICTVTVNFFMHTRGGNTPDISFYEKRNFVL